jgi:hypothetical protein
MPFRNTSGSRVITCTCFGGSAIRLGDHLGLVGADDHLAEILPGLAGSIGGREDAQRAASPDPSCRARASPELVISTAGEVGPVLGLAEQVGRRRSRRRPNRPR